MAYLNQIFYEGLGESVYVPLETKLKKINNKKLSKKIIVCFKIIYAIMSIIIALLLFVIRL